MEILQGIFSAIGSGFVNLYGIFAAIYTPEAGLVAMAGALGALIGLEREIAGKDPSLRTFALVCIGSCLFAIMSRQAVIGYRLGDPTRIAAQIVTGIGFLGAGAIFRGRNKVSGLTTAALMWVTAAIGVAVGFVFVKLALSTTLTVIFIILGLKMVHRIIRWYRPDSYEDESYDDY